MSAPSQPDPAVALFADFLYKNLIASTRAEDVGLSFYRRELTKQKATEADFRFVSLIAAIYFVERYDRTQNAGSSKPSVEDRYALLRESLEFALQEYAKRSKQSS